MAAAPSIPVTASGVTGKQIAQEELEKWLIWKTVGYR